MSKRRHDHWSRREFLSAAAFAGAGSLLKLRSEAIAAGPPLETKRIRLYKYPGICLAPQYVAEDLLRAEGFTDVQYVEFPEGASASTNGLALAPSTSPSGSLRRSSSSLTEDSLFNSWPEFTWAV